MQHLANVRDTLGDEWEVFSEVEGTSRCREFDARANFTTL